MINLEGFRCRRGSAMISDIDRIVLIRRSPTPSHAVRISRVAPVSTHLELSSKVFHFARVNHNFSVDRCIGPIMRSLAQRGDRTVNELTIRLVFGGASRS